MADHQPRSPKPAQRRVSPAAHSRHLGVDEVRSRSQRLAPGNRHLQSLRTSPRGGTNTPQLFGVVLVMALVAGITIGALAGEHNKLSNKVLDIGKAQQGVAQVLVDPINGYGLSSLGSVSCNGGSNPIVQQGNSFTCDVTVNQEQRHVTVVFQDDQRHLCGRSATVTLSPR